MKTPRSRPSPRAAASVAGLLVLAAALAACGGTAAAPTAAPATPTAAPATAAPTAEPAATPAPTPKATPAPTDFTSAAYGYRVTLPGASTTEPALRPWDGKARVDSDGPYTDKVRLPGSVLFFAYGAPTTMTTEEYAAQGQAQVAAWHGCPATADSVETVPVSGTPGELHAFLCQGLLVQKLMVVRDGQGLVLNMLAPPDGEVDPRALFREIVAGVTWPAQP
jgi:hypothetical protein